MRQTRKCAFCGKEFTSSNGMKRYCCEHCAEEAKKARRQKVKDFMSAVEPMAELRNQEYLTFAKAAVLMGCTRQYVYKLVKQGKLKASRLSSRMSFIRRADIERMLESSPYYRVLPCTKSPKKGTTKKNKEQEKNNEVLEYYSGEEVMEKFKVKQSWLYTSAKRNKIPMCRIAGRNYYSKKHIEELLGVSVDISKITEWLSIEEIAELYGMGSSAIHAYAYRHGIPSKREYGRTIYSKSHFDELRRTDIMNSEDYYTTEQVGVLYGLTSANIWQIVKKNGIKKVKVGVKNLLLKSDVERVMAERMAKLG